MSENERYNFVLFDASMEDVIKVLDSAIESMKFASMRLNKEGYALTANYIGTANLIIQQALDTWKVHHTEIGASDD